jgi:hypothetical protein
MAFTEAIAPDRWSTPRNHAHHTSLAESPISTAASAFETGQ